MNTNTASELRLDSQKQLESIINTCKFDPSIESQQTKAMLGKMASIIQSMMRTPRSIEAPEVKNVQNKKELHGTGVSTDQTSKLQNYQNKFEKPSKDNSQALLDQLVLKISNQVGNKMNTIRIDLGKVVKRLQQRHKTLEQKIQKVFKKIEAQKEPEHLQNHHEKEDDEIHLTEDFNNLVGLNYIQPTQWLWINQYNQNIEHVHIHGNTIIGKCPTAVFGAKTISECNHFQIFVKSAHDLAIGLGLQKYRSQGHRVFKKIGYQFGQKFYYNQCIELSNHGICWDGSSETKLSKGFQNGDIVAVDINLEDCTLTWSVNGQMLHKIRNEALMTKVWMPYVSLGRRDSIVIVNHN